MPITIQVTASEPGTVFPDSLRAFDGHALADVLLYGDLVANTPTRIEATDAGQNGARLIGSDFVISGALSGNIDRVELTSGNLAGGLYQIWDVDWQVADLDRLLGRYDDGDRGALTGAILGDIDRFFVTATTALNDQTLFMATGLNDTIDIDGSQYVDGVGGDDVIRVVEAEPGRGATLLGGNGADRLFGARGDDTISGGRDPDRMSGGGGNDLMSGGGGGDVVKGGGGNDRLLGEAGGDRLAGGAGRDTLIGGGGGDNLKGGGGNDRLSGGGAADTIDGGTGADRLSGGAGADMFVFGNKAGRDRILDFVAEVDSLSFRGDNAISAVEATTRGVLLTHDTGTILIVGGDIADWTL